MNAYSESAPFGVSRSAGRTGEVDAGPPSAAHVDAGSQTPVPELEQAVGQAHHVEGLHRAWLDADRPAELRQPGILVDDARTHAA